MAIETVSAMGLVQVTNFISKILANKAVISVIIVILVIIAFINYSKDFFMIEVKR